MLSLPRAQLDSFLGAVGVGLASKAAVLQALQQCKSLMVREACARRFCVVWRGVGSVGVMVLMAGRIHFWGVCSVVGAGMVVLHGGVRSASAHSAVV